MKAFWLLGSFIQFSLAIACFGGGLQFEFYFCVGLFSLAVYSIISAIEKVGR